MKKNCQIKKSPLKETYSKHLPHYFNNKEAHSIQDGSFLVFLLYMKILAVMTYHYWRSATFPISRTNYRSKRRVLSCFLTFQALLCPDQRAFTDSRHLPNLFVRVFFSSFKACSICAFLNLPGLPSLKFRSCFAITLPSCVRSTIRVAQIH
jgi:hypothetical protein